MNARPRIASMPVSDAEPSRGLLLPLSPRSGDELGPDDYRAQSQCLAMFTAFLAANREILAEYDISVGEHACLVEAQCGEDEGARSIGDLAQRLRVRHNTAVGMVTRLCDMGHVVRKRDAQDRRKVRLEVTRKGRQTLDQIVRRYWQALRELEPGLFPAEG